MLHIGLHRARMASWVPARPAPPGSPYPAFASSVMQQRRHVQNKRGISLANACVLHLLAMLHPPARRSSPHAAERPSHLYLTSISPLSHLVRHPPRKAPRKAPSTVRPLLFSDNVENAHHLKHQVGVRAQPSKHAWRLGPYGAKVSLDVAQHLRTKLS